VTLALALALWQWRPIPNEIWDVRGTTLGSALAILFWCGWAILLLSTFLINHFELFGLQRV
jgi:methanethiol S-methyltransferase